VLAREVCAAELETLCGSLFLPEPVPTVPSRDVLCRALCAPQGMAESRELEDFDGCKFSYCLISR
jgi:hypothetical protein